MRAIVELLMTIAVVLIARSVLTSVMRGIARASSGSFAAPPSGPAPSRSPSPGATPGGELHKDPVCGTYVAESAALTRSVGGRMFYYCSERCREAHALAAR